MTKEIKNGEHICLCKQNNYLPDHPLKVYFKSMGTTWNLSVMSERFLLPFCVYFGWKKWVVVYYFEFCTSLAETSLLWHAKHHRFKLSALKKVGWPLISFFESFPKRRLIGSETFDCRLTRAGEQNVYSPKAWRTKHLVLCIAAKSLFRK